MKDVEFLHLTTLYLEASINDAELSLLNGELATSPERVRQFNNLRLVTGLIHEHGRTIDTVSDEVIQWEMAEHERLASIPESSVAIHQVDETSQRVWPNSSFGPRVIVLAATAVAVLVSFFLFLDDREIESPADIVASGIATLNYTSHASWRGQVRELGDSFGSGAFFLEMGLARLDFRNGATLTLQGPAEFEILSSDRTVLNSGILTASIPESAEGFEVLTPAMDVVDLGTAFGISVGIDGETDVCVFEGEVEVCLANREDDRQLVREGNAVRSRPESNSIDSAGYSTQRYEEAWPVTFGVLQATGLMEFVSPGPDFVPGMYEDSERILVFHERSHVLLESDLKVSVAEPGQYVRVHRHDKGVIPAGKIIRSYLLQLNPIGEFTQEEVGRSRVIGQIIFDQPILGLIGGTTLLIETDSMLGHPSGDYGDTRRGIEPSRSNDLPDSGRDKVTLSPDRKTLSLDLSASTAVDQIRVLVED